MHGSRGKNMPWGKGLISNKLKVNKYFSIPIIISIIKGPTDYDFRENVRFADIYVCAAIMSAPFIPSQILNVFLNVKYKYHVGCNMIRLYRL